MAAKPTISVRISIKTYNLMLKHWGEGHISPEAERLIENEMCRREIELNGALPAMTDHIKAAIAAGKYRGEAEQDFGMLFPDDLWYELGGSHERARPEDC